MHEILGQLPAGARVLDLGSNRGSFPKPAHLVVIRADLDGEPDVRADAARLPFASAAFDALISNHSLEHFEDLDAALAEMRRVLKPEGALYVAVPDAGTFTDIVYRWLTRGGGHVNAFRSAAEVVARVRQATGLPYAGGRLLYSSFTFLNNRSAGWLRLPRKMLLFAGGDERFLRWMRWLFLQLRPSLAWYGWALFFGRVTAPIETLAWTNVCIRCGAGHASAWLEAAGLVERGIYACPACGARNFFTDDAAFSTSGTPCA